MPSTSAKQAKFMRAVAHSPKFAKKVGVPQSVGKDFEMADKKMKKFASAGRVGRRATEQAMTGVEDILKSAPALVAAAQSDKTAESELKSAMAPKKAQTFGEAFRAARRDPEAMKRGTFTWGGKTYTTKMADEGPSRPATTTASRRSGTGSSGTGSSGTASSGSAVGDFYLKQYSKVKDNAAKVRGVSAAESAAAQAKAGRSNVSTKDAASDYTASQEKKYGKSSGRPLILVGDAARRESAKKHAEIIARGERPGASTWEKSQAKFYRENPDAMKKGGSVKKYAKGGKIDGCAVRGKTRAMKKGK